MVKGEFGEAVQKAIKLIIRVGEALGAERLVPISHAHVSGVSYFNIGDAGLRFIEDLAAKGGRARVYATFNPAGVPLGLNEDVLPASKEEVDKQLRIVRALKSMGFRPTASCIPYMFRRPRLGEHLAWGESSAVAVANTLYGARTNREGGPIALAAAITGRIYYWGLHRDETRTPEARITVNTDTLDVIKAGLLGYYLGLNYPGKVLYVDARFDSKRSVISMCAAAAASGNTAMCIVKRFSPEERLRKPSSTTRAYSVTERDLVETRRNIENAAVKEAEAFFTGCPHHWFTILTKITSFLKFKGYNRLRRPVYVAVPALLPKWARVLAEKLKTRNVFIIPGTCIVVARLGSLYRSIATDSLKAAFYLPRKHGVSIALAGLREYTRVHGE